jgi:hypothetical protein
MAMDYLHLGVAAKTAAALVALIAIPVVALSFRGPLLSLARNPADIVSSRARATFEFRVATVPVVVVIGIAWIKAGAGASAK